LTFGEEVDYLVKTEAHLKGTTLKTAEVRIAGRLGVAPSTVQRWRYLKRKGSFKPNLKTPRGVSVEKSVHRSYLRRHKQKVFHKLSRRPPTLHVVCSPGGGAFSVYMFIRYALSQQNHFKAQVEMTMLCREEEDGAIEVEKWWNRWLDDETTRHCLNVPNGWSPQFLREENDIELPRNSHHTKQIFILAGGDQGRLVRAYWQQRKNRDKSQKVVLLTEEDLVKYYKEEFAIRSALDSEIDVLPNMHNLNPQECLGAVEIAQKAKLDELLNSPRHIGPIKPINHKKSIKNQGTFKVHWEKDIQFFEHEPTRIIVNVRPKFTDVAVADSFEYDDRMKLKGYVKDYIEEWFDWRKSLRFKLDEEFQEKLTDFFTRRPDARKLFMYDSNKESSRGKRYSANSILFNHPEESAENQSVAKSLILMAWDTKNIGRSTQFLSQRLETLEKNQSLLLLQFSGVKDEERTAESSLIIQSLNHQDGVLTMYNEDLEKLETRHISTTKCLKNKRYSSISLTTIGMNGPSLKTIINSIESSKDLQIFGENDIRIQSNKVDPLSVHRAFIRGIFPTKPLGEGYLKMEDFESQWLVNAGQIKYVTWLSQNAFVPERNTYLPNRLLCTMDSFGKVLHVFDSKQNEALEVLLYIALFICEDAAKGKFFTSSPNPEGFEIKTMFKTLTKYNSDMGLVEFPNMISTQNAEIWFTELKHGAFRHYVGDAKAIFHQPKSDALDRAEEAFTSLLSKYNWKTLHGNIRVVMLSFFGGQTGSLADDNPFIFSKESYYRVKKDNSNKSLETLYSIDLAHFSDYVKSFIRKHRKNVTPISYEEFTDKSVNGQSNFEVDLPFYQTESLPTKNQTSLHFFRKSPSNANEISYSGFFFDANTYDFQNAFYFRDKSLNEVADYFLSSQGRDRISNGDRAEKISSPEQVYRLMESVLDDNELLVRLEQITTNLGIESPAQDLQDRDYLSEWADDVLYHLYQQADERLTYDGETPPMSINDEALFIFNSAARLAKDKDPQSMYKFNDFLKGLKSFNSSLDRKPDLRYEWYLKEKARRSSQSSQSDA
jgi:hypothetical protein